MFLERGHPTESPSATAPVTSPSSTALADPLGLLVDDFLDQATQTEGKPLSPQTALWDKLRLLQTVYSEVYTKL